MSNAKLEQVKQAIYYVGGASEAMNAEKLRENIAKRRDKGKGIDPKLIPLAELGSKSTAEVPQDLILLAHTDDTRQYIGDKTPKELAKALAQQFTGDKTQLKSVKLISCEAGFGEPSLAFALVVELHKQGFTNTTVQAATHPPESKIGGSVSVINNAGIGRMDGLEAGQVQAVMHGNQKTADYLSWDELRRIATSRNKGTSEEVAQRKSKMEELAGKNGNFTNFDKKHPDFCEITLVSDIDDLDAPHNTFTNQGVQARLSLDAAIALNVLQRQRHTYRLPENKKAIAYITQAIQGIKQDPSINQNGILQILKNKDITKNVGKDIVAAIGQAISDEIAKKRTAMDPSVRPSKALTIASKIEDDTEYLSRLLKNDGFFEKIWRGIYGSDEFTKNLRLLTKQISDRTLVAKAEREEIIAKIERQKGLDSQMLTMSVGGFLGMGSKQQNSPLNTLYDALDNYCAKPNPVAGDWEVLQAANADYDTKQPVKMKSPELVKLIAQLDANNKKFNAIGTEIQGIQAQLTTAIQTYLGKHDKGANTDKAHKPKVAVMTAMHTYVNQPNAENWLNLEQSTQANAGWDKGFFSTVRHMMNEARKVHGEQEHYISAISP